MHVYCFESRDGVDFWPRGMFVEGNGWRLSMSNLIPFAGRHLKEAHPTRWFLVSSRHISGWLVNEVSPLRVSTENGQCQGSLCCSTVWHTGLHFWFLLWKQLLPTWHPRLATGLTAPLLHYTIWNPQQRSIHLCSHRLQAWNAIFFGNLCWCDLGCLGRSDATLKAEMLNRPGISEARGLRDS